MKVSLSKLLNIAIFLPILILLGTSGYYFYQNFMKYEKFQKSTESIELTKKLEHILVALGEERGSSSIYFVSKGNYPKSKLIVKAKRAQMNAAINDLKSFIDKHPRYYKEVKNVLILINKLPVIRKQIDSFKNIKFKQWFFGYYTVLESEILNTMNRLTNNFPVEVTKLYKEKIPYEKITAYTGIVRGFGSYYITADIPLSKEDYKLLFLKYYHDINLLPVSDISQNIFNSSFNKLESDIKTILFLMQQANMEYYLTGSFNGYPIDSIDYFNEFTKRISYFKKATQLLNKEISNKVTEISQEKLYNLIINGVILIIALLLVFLGIYIKKLINSHIKELSNLITSLTPITGEEINIDISSPEGLHKAVETVSKAIKITQESIKKSEEATKAKSLFLANMSHEIRTPLNGILGFLELLKTTPTTDEQREYISTIEQSAKNLLQIVNNILDVSKIESQKITLEDIDFKALDEFENAVEIFATPAAQKQIEYVVNISPDMPSVLKGDVLKIKEILTNLINNAIKFTHKNGSISVTIKYNGIKNQKAELYFEVQDTGIGMSEEQKAKIFEAFAQADESVTRKYGGTGLGLTIVKNYVEMMGGQIHVESQLNKGSKFYFTILLDIVDSTPRYQPSVLKNYTYAILNTEKNSLRKEASLNYLAYFGISKIGFNTAEELNGLINSENINAIVIFYEESNKDEIKNIANKNFSKPIIVISSYFYKEQIDKLAIDVTIFDPVTPTKTYNSAKSLQEARVQKHISKEEIPQETYPLKVLIAEDNPINLQLLKTTLKNMGIEADTAQNGLEAFNKYSMNPEKYDAIFMDVQMPVMDGLEATQEILEFEEEEEVPHTPIIAVTANVLKGDRERFLGAGMDDYISKPINKEELKRVLDQIAKHRYEKTFHINTAQPPKEAQEAIIKKEEIAELPIDKTQKKYIIASESSFLINYIKDSLKEFNFEVAQSLKALNTLIDRNKFNIILIEEDFANANISQLIKTIKNEFPNTRIIVIGEQTVKEADGNVTNLNIEEIKNEIKKVSE